RFSVAGRRGVDAAAVAAERANSLPASRVEQPNGVGAHRQGLAIGRERQRCRCPSPQQVRFPREIWRSSLPVCGFQKRSVSSWLVVTSVLQSGAKTSVLTPSEYLPNRLWTASRAGAAPYRWPRPKSG